MRQKQICLPWLRTPIFHPVVSLLVTLIGRKCNIICQIEKNPKENTTRSNKILKSHLKSQIFPSLGGPPVASFWQFRGEFAFSWVYSLTWMSLQTRRRRGGRETRAPLSFGIPINPIWTKGGRLCPPYSYRPPPIILDDAASLHCKQFYNILKVFRQAG